MPKFQTVRGMRDYLPPTAEKLRHVEATAREIARLYNFEEVITPTIEHYSLLAAKSGKEIKARMYSFDDLGGRKVALRPEFTASIARVVAITLRNDPKPLRLFSTGNLFRYDEPQFGRYREFWQSNYEIFGSSRPEADAEILSVTDDLMQRLGLRKYSLKIGHIGILRGLLSEEGVKEEQQDSLLQLLDAKRTEEALEIARMNKVSDQGLAILKKVIGAKGREGSHILARVKKTLQGYETSIEAIENLQQIVQLHREGGARAGMSIETGFARGLEYYSGMIFEVLVPEMRISLGGGGRYDKLVELFGGEPTPAVGVAPGLDRIVLALDEQDVALSSPRQLVALIPIGDETLPKAMELASQLRRKGVPVKLEIMGRTLARALQDAHRRKAAQTIILGPDELKIGKATLRNMKTRRQRLISIEDVVKYLSEEETLG